MVFSILSQAAYSGQVPFGDVLSSKAAVINFALTASFVALQPAFQDLVHTFLDTEIPTIGAVSTFARSASLAVMGVASAMFSDKSGSAFIYQPPTATTQSFESSTGCGPLVGVIACATFSVVGAAIALSGRSTSSAGSLSPSGGEGEETPNGETPNFSGGNSGEDPGPPGDSTNDVAQSEDSDHGDSWAGNMGGSGPPPPPPPPSFNATDAGGAGGWLPINVMASFGSLLLMAYAFTSKSSPFRLDVKAADSGVGKDKAGRKLTNLTTIADVGGLAEFPTVASLSLHGIAVKPAMVAPKVLVEAELADVSKRLVYANELFLPLPSLDVVEPALPTPNMIPFPVPSILSDAIALSPIPGDVQLPPVARDVLHRKPITYAHVPGHVCAVVFVAVYLSAVYIRKIFTKLKATFVKVSNYVVDQPSKVPGSFEDSIIEESTSNGLALQDEDGWVEIEDATDLCEAMVKSKVWGGPAWRKEMLALVSALDGRTATASASQVAQYGHVDAVTLQQPEVPIVDDSTTFEEESTGNDPVLELEDTLVEQERTVDLDDEIKCCNDSEQYETVLALLSTTDEGTFTFETENTVVVEFEEDGVEINIKEAEITVKGEAAQVEVDDCKPPVIEAARVEQHITTQGTEISSIDHLPPVFGDEDCRKTEQCEEILDEVTVASDDEVTFHDSTIADDSNGESAGSAPVLEHKAALVECERTVDTGDEIKHCDETEQCEDIPPFLSSMEVEIEDVELDVEAEPVKVEAEVKHNGGQNSTIEDVETSSSIERSTIKVEDTAVKAANVEEVGVTENVRFDNPVLLTEDAKIEKVELEILAGVAGPTVGVENSATEAVNVNSSEGPGALEAEVVEVKIDEPSTIAMDYDAVPMVEDAHVVKSMEEIVSDMGQVPREIDDQVTSPRDGMLLVPLGANQVQAAGILATNDSGRMLLEDVVEAVGSELRGEVPSEIGKVSYEIEDGCGEEITLTKGDKGKKRDLHTFVEDWASPAPPGLNSRASAFDPNLRPRVPRTEDVRSRFQRVVQCDVDQPPQPIATHTTTSYRKCARKVRWRY